MILFLLFLAADGPRVYLDGSRSSDSDGDRRQFEWRRREGRRLRWAGEGASLGARGAGRVEFELIARERGCLDRRSFRARVEDGGR